jgi:hypothetical protein
MVISVLPGAGAGLHDPCSGDLVIKTINEIGPDLLHRNFAMLTDGCYNVERGYLDGVDWIPDFGLTFENTCHPKCTAEQLGAYAHYLNRVKDGMQDLITFASDLYTELAEYIEEYKTTELPAANAPVIKTAITEFDDGYGSVLYSLVVSFFNRSKEPINITCDLPSDVFIKGRYKCGDQTLQLASYTFAGTLDCLANGRIEATMSLGGFTITATAGTTELEKTFGV